MAFFAAGVGVASFDSEVGKPVSGSDSDVALAGLLAIGMSYAISANVDLAAETDALLRWKP